MMNGNVSAMNLVRDASKDLENIQITIPDQRFNQVARWKSIKTELLSFKRHYTYQLGKNHNARSITTLA
jgi:hypothetical protein